MESSCPITSVIFVLTVIGSVVVNGLNGRICHVNGKVVCCSNHFNNNGTCKECHPGYKKLENDMMCTPCQDGFFGRSCASLCICKDKKSCNHVTGECIKKKVSTDNTTPTTREDEKDSECFSKFVFVTGLCGAAVVSGFISVLLYRVRQKCVQQRKNKCTRNLNDAVQDYQYIDELQMSEISSKKPTKVKSENEIEVKENEMSIGSHEVKGNYLTPYHPKRQVMIENQQMTLHLTADRKSNLYQDGYLNPYSPLVKTHNEDEHAYNKCITQSD